MAVPERRTDPKRLLAENIRLSKRLEEALDTKAAWASELKELRRREKTVWLVLLKAAKKACCADRDLIDPCEPLCLVVEHVEQALGDYDER